MLTVKDYIDALQKFDPELPVLAYDMRLGEYDLADAPEQEDDIEYKDGGPPYAAHKLTRAVCIG